MKKILTPILILLSIICFSQQNENLNNEIITEKFGDLDKDGINEKVIVLNTKDSTDDGIIREIQIFKKDSTKWRIWRKSENAILKSEEGGMMGEPFEGIEIKNGILIIYHFGGSSWKWSKTDKYRFQNNEFELIGYNSNYGKPCEYWTNFDFNLTTGNITYKKEFESCETENIYKTETESFKKEGVIVKLDNRNNYELKITTPKLNKVLHL